MPEDPIKELTKGNCRLTRSFTAPKSQPLGIAGNLTVEQPLENQPRSGFYGSEFEQQTLVKLNSKTLDTNNYLRSLGREYNPYRRRKLLDFSTKHMVMEYDKASH